MRDRYKILEDITNYRGDIRKLTDELQQHPYDLREGERPGYQTRKDLLSVFDRYFSGELSEKDLQDWADTLAYKEDIDNEEGYNILINTILQNMAERTDFNKLITREEISKWFEQLKTTPFDSNEN